MHAGLIAAGFVVAVAAALRSTWSPCGLSMLSSITPLGEAGRGHRFRSTATWFVVGAALGGATLGALSAALAAGVGALGPSPAAVTGAAVAVCAAAAAADLGLLGDRMPLMRRQVNELWLDQYRGWVYGAGFGWQIGVGFATYIMSVAVVALVPLGALTGSPWIALTIGVTFGTLRGLTVLLGLAVTSIEALQAVHRRLDRLRRPVQLSVGAVLASVALALGAVAWPMPTADVASVLLLLGAAVAGLAIRRTRRLPGLQ
jgi:hypothetical protein